MLDVCKYLLLLPGFGLGASDYRKNTVNCVLGFEMEVFDY
jgi:hypothetical protein